MPTIEENIVDAIKTRVQGVAAIKYYSDDRIRLATDDFQDHEIPAAQLWDVGQFITHERSRVLVTWSFSLEIIMKSMTSGEVNQRALWALRREIALALWAKPVNLGIPGVIHPVYTGNVTDLHLVEPFYIARIDFDVLFYDDLTGPC
jgi:hypothetical protein